ncbi:hypothetical protein Hypma_005954 [Hypsizygus marmoreus]|uniref:Uncharacterized protein n=1 Tax=Hypsizygus marmoreus TaxID=39966 RepID=A0A369KAE1_HYPMA|nr:hypothetical protein Hypma_005954 [Hypsizygus marmoreus]
MLSTTLLGVHALTIPTIPTDPRGLVARDEAVLKDDAVPSSRNPPTGVDTPPPTPVINDTAKAAPAATIAPPTSGGKFCGSNGVGVTEEGNNKYLAYDAAKGELTASFGFAPKGDKCGFDVFQCTDGKITGVKIRGKDYKCSSGSGKTSDGKAVKHCCV